MDIALTYDGRALISDNGDFLLTDGFDEKVREISRLVRTEVNGWKIYPSYGTPLHDFVGRPNTQETADELTRTLEIYLNTFVKGIGVLKVRVVPMDQESVDIFIFAYNGTGELPVGRVVYNYKDGIVVEIKDPMEKKENVLQKGQHSLPTNPYLKKADV